MKPYASGIIELLNNPSDNFWSGLGSNPSNNRAWISGYRGRTSWKKLQPTLSDIIDFSGPDSAIAVCRAHDKFLTLSFQMGIDCPTDFFSVEPICTEFVTANGSQPLPWEQSYREKAAPFIAACGRKYDPEPVIREIFVSGFMQGIELHFLGSVEEYNFVTAKAQAAGFANAEAAFLYGAKQLIDLWVAAFPTTSVVLTTAPDPFVGFGPPNTLSNDLEDYIVDTYPQRGGWANSFLKATLTHSGIPAIKLFPHTRQAIFDSRDDRFYAPPMPVDDYPPPPTPVQDLVLNGFDVGCQGVEVYKFDINNSVNDGVLQDASGYLPGNLPSFGLPGNKATITVKT